ncbi:MAG: hypothetical protein N2111_02500 [Candidatus Sumerlaeaceae bacterium]|nr:hypothetical protein [Candidatus Sumerlaeaceae bacterium]
MDGHLKLLIPVGTVIESAALIIFWRTEGFGKTDEGIALTEPLPLDAGLTSGRIERSFSVVAPQIPWTYFGRLIKNPLVRRGLCDTVARARGGSRSGVRAAPGSELCKQIGHTICFLSSALDPTGWTISLPAAKR